MNQITKVVTHNGIFHADEVFACATIRNFYPEVKIIRSRNPMLLEAALEDANTVLVDVGGVFDPERLAFDHHQREGAPEPRENEVPFSSFGLVWRHFKGHVPAFTDFVYDAVDKELVQPIDRVDCGYGERTEGVYSISQAVSGFNGIGHDKDEEFHSALDMAQTILYNVMAGAITKQQNQKRLSDRIKNPIHDGKVIVLGDFVPDWQDRIIKESDALYVAYRDVSGEWRLQCVPKEAGSFESRKPLPEEWTLKDAKPVKDFVFCHKNRFICGTKSLIGMEELMRILVA